MPIPNVPEEFLRSGQSVAKTVREAQGKGWLDTGMNKATGGLAELAKQAFIVLPHRLFVRPVVGGLNSAVQGTVRNVADFTGTLITSIPWIPVPGRGSSPERSGPLASNHDKSPPALPRPGDLRIGQGPDARGSDAEPGSGGRAA